MLKKSPNLSLCTLINVMFVKKTCTQGLDFRKVTTHSFVRTSFTVMALTVDLPEVSLSVFFKIPLISFFGILKHRFRRTHSEMFVEIISGIMCKRPHLMSNLRSNFPIPLDFAFEYEKL